MLSSGGRPFSVGGEEQQGQSDQTVGGLGSRERKRPSGGEGGETEREDKRGVHSEGEGVRRVSELYQGSI